MADLDLTKGLASATDPPRRPSAGPSAAATAKRAEEALKGELEGVFGRIGDLYAAREDPELAVAFEEDKRVLAQGLVSITDTVVPLRKPLTIAVHLVEPVLAFGRIVGIYLRRVRMRFEAEEELPPQ